MLMWERCGDFAPIGEMRLPPVRALAALERNNHDAYTKTTRRPRESAGADRPAAARKRGRRDHPDPRPRRIRRRHPLALSRVRCPGLRRARSAGRRVHLVPVLVPLAPREEPAVPRLGPPPAADA